MNQEQWENKLLVYYTKHQPSQADPVKIKALLEKSKTNPGWDKLFEIIQKKYGNDDTTATPVPAVSQSNSTPPDGKSAWREKLMNYYLLRAPQCANDNHVESVLRRFEAIGYDEMWRMLILKYGAEPQEEDMAAVQSITKQRLEAQGRLKVYFEKVHPPSATSDVVNMWLDRYGVQGEKEMYEALYEKYGDSDFVHKPVKKTISKKFKRQP
eukprot:PhF_6_TR10861/c0_g1_i1/m.17598